MSQVSWRAEADLVVRVKQAAAERGWSMNEFISIVLDVATDPSRAAHPGGELRERLRRAGLLAPVSAPTSSPDADEVARAVRSLRGETTITHYVIEGRV